MDSSFIKACKEGNLEEAINIYNKDKPNIHADNDLAFRYACINGYINIAQWLYELEDKPNIHALDDFAFIYACFYGHINIAQWLFGFDDKPNIHALDDFAFRFACYKEHINIASWLVSICDDYHIEIEYGKIKNWKIKNSLQDLYENKEYDKIIEKLKIQKNDDVEIETCSICYEENSNFLTSCNHNFCIDCFMEWYIGHNKKECSYCMQNIIIEKCTVKN